MLEKWIQVYYTSEMDKFLKAKNLMQEQNIKYKTNIFNNNLRLADTEDGAAFMKQFFPESYQNANGIQLAETLKRLFQYTTADAMHTDFDVAFTNFFSGKAAMIPNGYWMIEQIPEEQKEKIRFSAFPGNKLVSSTETFGWAVVSGYPKDVQKGAVEFLKFRTYFNQKEKQQLIESGKE